jgi:hypothetical protein
MGKTAIWFVVALASLMLIAGCERKVVVENSGVTDASSCFTCHGDDGLILTAQGEWANSGHASGNYVQYTNRGGFYDCTRCHDHQGFLDYVATGTVNGPYENASAIHCFTCHAPHTNGNLSLRTQAAYELENGEIYDHGKSNLCATCHHSRLDVGDIVDGIAVSAHWGPHHGPQADLLEGTGGYEYDDYDYESSSHATAVTDACVGCHMGHAEIFDGYKVGGHSMNMVDLETGTDLADICQGCHDDATSYDWVNADDIDFDHDGEVEGYQSETEGLIDSLKALLADAGVIDSTGEPVDQDIADAGVAGALYNMLLVEEDKSEGIHNFRYIYGLLQSSIDYMNTEAATTSKKFEMLAAHD